MCPPASVVIIIVAALGSAVSMLNLGPLRCLSLALESNPPVAIYALNVVNDQKQTSRIPVVRAGIVQTKEHVFVFAVSVFPRRGASGEGSGGLLL